MSDLASNYEGSHGLLAIAGGKGALHKIPQHRLEERPANRTRRGVETAVLGPIQDWRRLEQGAGRTVKDLSLGPGPCFQNLAPKRGAPKPRKVVEFK